MKILVTGANGYIGSRLLLKLLNEGHQVVAMVRNKEGMPLPANHPNITIITADLYDPASLANIPDSIEIAFYLVHALSYGSQELLQREEQAIHNFISRLRQTDVKQIIYLSGLISSQKLSPHLASRYRTECIIKESGLPYTVLRAGIIVGSGSASFEIIRDLTEKLPVMVAPRWVNNLCQPLAISDVLFYLTTVMNNPACIKQEFDIGGPDILSYKDILLGYAKVRDLKRTIFVVPVLTPKLSSYWLYFITSVNFTLASSLVESLKNDAICKSHTIDAILPHNCLSYEESVKLALALVELSPSWKDSLIPSELESKLSKLGEVPTHGCLVDQRSQSSEKGPKEIINKIWAIGGDTGWYYMDWAWNIRGFIDKLFLGVGLQRGRTHPTAIHPGYSLDFWRVLAADKEKGHLLLYAEMKLPGEAWLEFKVEPSLTGSIITQTASFRPKGLFGRLYWYAMLPFHYFIFRGMLNEIAKG